MDKVAQEISKFIEQVMDISIEALIVQLSAFLVLILAIRIFLWKNVTELLDKRKAAINEQISSASKKEAEANKNLEEAAIYLSDSRNQASKIINDAYVTAEKQSQDLIDKTNTELKHKKKYAELELELEIAKSKDDIKEAIKDVAFAAAEQIIEREVSKDDHAKVIEDAVKKVGV